MSDVFTHAGLTGYLILFGTIVGLVAAAGVGGLAISRRRVPLAAMLLIPYLLLAAGAFGAWISTAGVLGDVTNAEPNRIPLVAMAGAWNAMTVDWLARWCAAFALVATAWGAAVGSALMPGEEPRLTPVAAGGAAVTTLIGAGSILGYAWMNSLGAGAYMLGFLVLIGGFAVAFAATRRATDDDMFRVAGMRFAASMTVLFGVWHGMRAVDIGNRINAFAADGPVLNTPEIQKAIDLFGTTVDPGMTIGVVALAFAIIIAFFGFFSEIGEVVVRYTVFDMFAVVAIAVSVGLLRIIESAQFNVVYRVATNLPAVEMYEEMGPALGSSMLTRGEVSVPTRLADGGFGDLYAYEPDLTVEIKQGEDRVYEWIRKFKWNGKRWVEDGEKLSDLSAAQMSDRPPLFAVERSLPADLLMEALEKTGNKGLLMLRAAEVKPGTFVPPELARLQLTFLPIEIRDRNLKTDLWLVAGSPEVNFGPTVWYGDKDDSLDPVEYAGAAIASTQATGLHIITTSRKVSDLVTSCLPFLIDAGPSADGITPSTQLNVSTSRWCAVTKDDFATVRAEAAGLWDLPAPVNVTMQIIPMAPVSDTNQVEDLLRRELGGIGYCAEKAVAAAEVLTGRMTLKLALSKDGTVYDTSVDPESKVQSPTISRCAGKRFRKIAFALIPEDQRPAPAPAPAPRGRGRGRPGPPVPPPPPHVLVHLDF